MTHPPGVVNKRHSIYGTRASDTIQVSRQAKRDQVVFKHPNTLDVLLGKEALKQQ